MEKLIKCRECRNSTPADIKICPKCGAIFPPRREIDLERLVIQQPSTTGFFSIIFICLILIFILNQMKPRKEEFQDHLAEEIENYAINHDKEKVFSKVGRKIQLRLRIYQALNYLPIYKSYGLLSTYTIQRDDSKEAQYFGFMGLIFSIEDTKPVIGLLSRDLIEESKPEKFPSYVAPPPSPVDFELEMDAIGLVANQKNDEINETYSPKPTKKSLSKPRYEKTYFQFDGDISSRLKISNKIISVQLAVATPYDDRVIENIKRHQIELRKEVIGIMKEKTEDQLAHGNFRLNLAKEICDAMNLILEKREDFGGIEEVYFTSFLVKSQ